MPEASRARRLFYALATTLLGALVVGLVCVAGGGPAGLVCAATVAALIAAKRAIAAIARIIFILVP